MQFAMPLSDSGIVSHGGNGVARSYDHRGLPFSWQPSSMAPTKAALDIEAKDNTAGSFMRTKYDLDVDEFLLRWTFTEVLAKLLDVPMLAFVRHNGLVEASFEWQRPQPGDFELCGIFNPQSKRPSSTPNEAIGVGMVMWVRNVDVGTHWAAIGLCQES